jgi:hypothetical protein
MPPVVAPADLDWLFAQPARAPRRLWLRLPAINLGNRQRSAGSERSGPGLAGRGEGPRRRRALAVLGAAGLLLAGYSITASEPEPAVTSSAVQAVPEYSDEAEWADRAEVALASVNEQLDLIAQTQAAWNGAPDAVRTGMPDPLQRLLERKAYLEAQKAMLQADLAAYRSLKSAADDLRLTEARLAQVDRALRPVEPSAAPTGPVPGLEATKARLERERDAKRENLKALSEGVKGAMQTPLPEDARPTTDASDQVLSIVKDPKNGGKPHDPSIGRRPEAIGGRNEYDANPAATIDTSGPPDPRGPGDDSAERREETPAVPGADDAAVASMRAATDSAPAASAPPQQRAAEAPAGTDAPSTGGTSTEAAKPVVDWAVPGYAQPYSDALMQRTAEEEARQRAEGGGGQTGGYDGGYEANNVHSEGYSSGG